MKVAVLRHRRVLIVTVHLALAAASYVLAYLLRFEGQIPPEHATNFLRALPWLLVLRALIFWRFRLYEGLWRYASLWDLNNIIGAVATSSMAFAILIKEVLVLEPYPRSIFILDSVLLIFLLGGTRLLRRAYREFNRFEHEKRILIYGAGDAGEMLIRDMKNNRFYNWDPIGFVDDDTTKVGRLIHGVRVLGTRDQLQEIVKREQPHEIVMAMPRIDPVELRRIVKSLEHCNVPIKTMPNLRDVLDGKVSISAIRGLSLDDLMVRRPVELSQEPVCSLINGRRVLVTGAGGSIGSELSRQVAAYGPARLVLFERYENSLFDLCNELTRTVPNCVIDPVIGDIGDAGRVASVFSETKPDIVFHAAAHKHVPLMEQNITEAIKNNIRGTRMVAEASLSHGVREFLLISSDKAVNPSSIMGASKRVAELLIRSMNRPGGTRFVAVRFGNVLGSNGSVTRLFSEQIQRGGPVTVTHPDMRRYFMLIPEAVQLVLHAAAMRDDDAIYALEMGEPMRIDDLARNLIRLSGYVPDEEIRIQYVGLRPGEKLSEQLVEDGEMAEPSDIPNIMRVRSAPVRFQTLAPRIALIEQAADAGSAATILRLMSELVPTFRAAVPLSAVEPCGPEARSVPAMPIVTA